MARSSKKKGFSRLLLIAGLVVCLLAGAAAGAAGQVFALRPEGYYIPPTETFTPEASAGEGYEASVITSYDLSIHFLELGNKYTGDCTLVKVGDTEVLIDAGSTTGSIPTIAAYLGQYVEGALDYVIVTHAHEDHYAGFATGEGTDSLFDLFVCETVITFSQTTSGKEDQRMYRNFERELREEEENGATVYTAAECVRGENGASPVFDLGNGVELQILDSYYYYNRASSENDHSVCAMVNQGEGESAKHYLFTGDLEEDGEEYLVEMNDLPQVDLYKAGHHGSKTSSTNVLLNVIRPEIVCVCCCTGSPEYTKTNENQFPTQEFIDRVAPYTDKVYATSLCVDYSKGAYTSLNGNIAVCANAAGAPVVYASDNTTLLKDTAWFGENRRMPEAWQAEAAA